jgi:hypothetical protein
MQSPRERRLPTTFNLHRRTTASPSDILRNRHTTMNFPSHDNGRNLTEFGHTPSFRVAWGRLGHEHEL